MNIQQAKELFFAQYFGQEVSYLGMVGKLSFDDADISIKVKGHSFKEEGYLLLRPINKLTDEEKINLSIISDQDAEDELYADQHLCNGNFILSELNKGERYCFQLYQYLLLIGILLPFTYLNDDNKPIILQVEEIINLNWAKIN